MCCSFKCASTVSTNPAYPQIACIKTKNTFLRDQDFYFYYKSVVHNVSSKNCYNIACA